MGFVLIHANTDIVAVSEDKQPLIDFRDSLPLVERIMYVVAKEENGYYLKERGW